MLNVILPKNGFFLHAEAQRRRERAQR